MAILFVASASASDLNETAFDDLGSFSDEDDISIGEIENYQGNYSDDKLSQNRGCEIIGANYTPKDSNEIQTCIDRAADGDTIVLDGYYLINSTVNVGKKLNFIGVNDATVDGNNAVGLFSISKSEVTFKNITFKRGHSEFGGAIYSADYVTVAVENCTFINNYAGSGGAAYSHYGGISFVGCSFKDNHASNGGAIYREYSDEKIFNSFFMNNTADENGGAIYDMGIRRRSGFGYYEYFYYGGEYNGCIFVDNLADYGGAVYATGYNFIDNCIFNNNHALDIGGAIHVDTIYSSKLPNIEVQGCAFSNNVADNAGAIYNSGSGLINCSIFSNNSARENGAVFTQGSIINCTLTNSAVNSFLNVNNVDFVLGKDYILTASLSSVFGSSSNKLIIFTVNGNDYTVHTDNDGLAIFNATDILTVTGQYNASVRFEGDDSFAPAFKNFTILIVPSKEVQYNAFSAIQTAINVADPGDTIILNGYYDNDCHSELVVDKHINFVGINNAVLDSKGFSRIFNITSDGVTFENITFKNGYCSYTTNNGLRRGYGGAIYVDSNEFSVVNCSFINNYAYTDGGAMCVFSNNFSIVNCTFVNNSKAVYCYGNNGSISGCSFVNNSLGAIGSTSNDFSVVNCSFVNNSIHAISFSRSIGNCVVNCSFVGNSAGSNGGTVYFDESEGSVVSCSFVNNTAKDSDGGAVYFSGNGGYILECIFVNNSAKGTRYGNGGAIYFSNNGGGSVVNCSFVGNSATNCGGAVYGREYSVINCNFTDNTANQGGAIYQGSAFDSNFYHNVASTDGGAIYDGIAVNSTFINNHADNDGGAVYKSNINKCLLEYNSASNGGAMSGTKATNSIFNHNTATDYGGAVFNAKVSLNSKFNNNSANKGNDTYNVTFFDSNTYPFVELNELINNNTNPIIYLYKNYMYDSSIDFNLKEGIVINRTLTIYGNGFTIDADNIARIFRITGDNVLFQDIVFVNGKTTGNGGAIYSASEDFSAVNCTFIDNSAKLDGGAVYRGSMINCSFVRNSASDDGGALYGGSAMNCTFIDNSARISGGAMLGGSAVNCSFIGNSVENWGGAVYGGFCVKCTFENNSAGYGGAVHGMSSVVNCSFTGNSAKYGGAMLGGSAVNCSFIGNSAKYGGALYSASCVNCTFIDNSAESYGGAIYGSSAVNCSFINNFPIYVGYTDKCTLTDCILDRRMTGNVVYYYTSYLTAENLAVTLGEDGYLTAKLFDIQGSLAGKIITFTIKGNNYNATTDSSGFASLNIRNIINESGIFNVFVSFDGDDVNSLVSSSVTVSVKSKSFLNVNDLSIFMEDSGFLVANLTDVSEPLFGKIITFSISGREYNVTTGIDGLARLNIKNLLNESGSYDVNVVFKGDEFTNPSSAVSHVVIEKYDSILKVNDLKIKIDENGALRANLYDSRGQLSNKELHFTIRGRTYITSTDVNGFCELPISNILTESGTYTAAVTFSGDEFNNPVSVNALVIIEKYDSALAVNNLSVVLGDDGILLVNLTGIKGSVYDKTIIFAVGSDIYINQTDAEGLARFNVKNIFTEVGTFAVGVSFGGDFINKPVSSKAYVTVNTNAYNLTMSQEGRYYANTNLTFKLRDFKTGESIGDTQITLTFSNGLTVTKTTDSNGEFVYEIPFAPGTYNVTAVLSLPNIGMNMVGQDTFEVSKFIGRIDISQDENCRILNVMLYDSVTGYAFANMNVSLSFEPNGEQFIITTDDEGRAAFNMDFDFGTYCVTAEVLGEFTEFDNVVLEDIVINDNSNSQILTQDSLEFDYGSAESIGVIVLGGDVKRENIHVVNHPEADISLSGTVITISGLDAGNYTLCIKSTPDNRHNAVTRSIPVTVRKINSTLSVPDLTFDYGDCGRINVNVSGGNISSENIFVIGHDEAVIAVDNNIICVSNLSVGSYNLSVTVSPDSNHEAVSSISYITVNKVDSVINIDEITFDYGGFGYSNLTVIGGSVSVENIQVVGQDALIRVSGNTLSVSGLNAGSYTLRVSSKEDENHNPVTLNVGVTVNEIDSNVEFYNSVSANYGGSSLTFMKFDGCSVLEENIFVVDHPEAIIKLEDDKIIVSNLTAGNYVLNVVSSPDENHKSVTRSASITVNRVDSLVKFRDLTFDYLQYDTTYITVEGGSVLYENIRVVGHPEAIIDFDGDTITVSNLSAGIYTLRVITTPDENHKYVVGEGKITVNRIDSIISFTSDEIVFDEGSMGFTNVNVVGGVVLEENLEVIGHDEAIVNITDNCISISNLTAGSYALHVATTPDENHNSVMGIVNVIVQKIPSVINFTGEIVFDYNGVGTTAVKVSGGSVGPSDILVLGHPEAEIHINNKNIITVANLTAGNYVLEVTTTPDADHRSSLGHVNITVNRIASKISCEDIVCDYDEIIIISVNVDGGILNTSDVKIEGYPNANVRANGNSIRISGLNVGSYTMHISSIPDKNHFASNNTAAITVNRIDSIVDLLNPIEFSYGGSDYTSVYLEGCSIRTDNITVLDSSGNKVDAKVTYDCNVISVSGLDAGSYRLNIVSTPDSNHKSVTASMNVTVSKVASEIKSYNPIVFDYLGVGSTYITVNGGSLSGSKMSVSGHGEAVISYEGNQIRVSNLNPGSYSLRVESIPDANHNADVKYITVTVNKMPVRIEAKSKTVALKKGSWTVRVLDSNNNPVSNMLVTLKVYTGKKFITVTVKTNARGEATYNTKKLSKGTHKVIASIEHIGYSASPVTSSVKVIKQKALKFKVKKNIKKDGSSLSITVKYKNKPINGVKLKLKVYDGKKLVKTVTLKTKTKGKYKGVAGWGTNKLKAGSHKVVIMPASITYSGSKSLKMKIKSSAKKYPKWETKI